MIQLLTQLLVMVLLVLGWGYWVWFGTGRQNLSRAGWWVWCLLSGVGVHSLLLQQLWYLGFSVSRTSIVSGVVALGGLVGWLKTYVDWQDFGKRWAVRHLRAFAIVGLSICILHGWSIGWRGPSHYFGRAEYDQFNYVVTAQFLMDYGAGDHREITDHSPLLLRAREAAGQRITQSILHAEVACLSRSDAQESYGAATLFFLFLLGLSVLGYLLALNIKTELAIGGSIIVIVIPAVTNVHLNCFLSQTSAVWTLIATPGLLMRAPYVWRRAFCAGSILAFLIGSYTEFAPLGVGVVILSSIIFVPKPKRLVILGSVLLTSLILNIGYLFRAAGFFMSQVAQASDSTQLASWVPGSGTWMGFGRNFAPDLPSGILTVIGLLVAVLVLLGFGLLRTAFRKRLIVLIATPSIAVGFLLLLPHLPAYAFGKLLISSSPVFCTALVASSAKMRYAFRFCGFGFVCIIGILGLWELSLGQKEIIDGTDKIDRADVSARKEISKVLLKKSESPPAFIISAEDSLTTAWLYYYLRNESCYMRYLEFSDRLFPSAWNDFRRPPAGLTNAYLAEPERLSPWPNYDPYPRITVAGGERRDQGVVQIWHSSGDLTFTMEFIRPMPDRLRWFCFELHALPASNVEVEVVTAQGIGTITSGRRWALAGRMESKQYTVRLHSKTGQPFWVTFFGIEPVHRPIRLPYRFELVEISAADPRP